MTPAARVRLERLEAASPLYAQLIDREPELVGWLEEETREGKEPPRYPSLISQWGAFAGTFAEPEARLARLRQWRRRMSMRIAYLCVNGLIGEPQAAAELSVLAEFCLVECLGLATLRWRARFGEPWDDEANRPSRLAVIALGKLGGGELNFSSDIDLLFLYEGDGFCRNEGRPTGTSSVECLTKIAETTIRMLSDQTAEGFLFRVDARLRPGGAWGPLVPSFSSLESYYAANGQTWERIALIKARPVAGDLALASELLDELHSFRYPRRPPPSLLAEIAVMKRRTEKEVVGTAALKRNVKLGPGGIREIEFAVQALQLLHGGANPFLQTHATTPAIEGLARYGFMNRGIARDLIESYWFLRRVEHRLQMRDERQTHELPEDPAEVAALGRSLGFGGGPEFLAALDARRSRVRGFYGTLFAEEDIDREYGAWWAFFTGGEVPAPVAARLERWFGSVAGSAEALRVFVAGGHRRHITRELVTRFQQLAERLDAVLPGLARPIETLGRLARCAERYGSRQQFLNACAANPQLLRVLALLCDRSTYATELICAHPEILEEVLRPEILRRRKTPAQLDAELAAAPNLWLYLRAEQIRSLIGELLGFLSQGEVESELCRLADAALRRVAGNAGPLVVAVGKYGGGELVFGSDLDLFVVAETGREAEAESTIARLRATLHDGGPLGPAFPLDFRLRPHGDAGPLSTTLPILSAYHRLPEGALAETPAATAWTWEKQMLTRARPVCGPAALTVAFLAWRERLLFSAPLGPSEEADIWAMRDRVEREREPVVPPERAIKTGPGGLMDFDFAVQVLQLRHGHSRPSVRVPNSREAFSALIQAGVIPLEAAARLADNHAFLQRIEYALRRDVNRAVSLLPAEDAEREVLARWLGFAGGGVFWAELLSRMAETHRLVREMRQARLESGTI